MGVRVFDRPYAQETAERVINRCCEGDILPTARNLMIFEGILLRLAATRAWSRATRNAWLAWEKTPARTDRGLYTPPRLWVRFGPPGRCVVTRLRWTPWWDRIGIDAGQQRSLDLEVTQTRV